MKFFDWLSRQASRPDPVGAFAKYAIKDKIFPRTKNELHVLLLRYEHMPEQREAAKVAHAEWRKTRRKKDEKVA